MTQHGFHGLIQHSFALRNHESHRPFDGTDAKRMVEERFGTRAPVDAGFAVSEIGVWSDEPPFPGPSPLLRHQLTSLDRRRRGRFVKWGGDGAYETSLPPAFSWAATLEPEKLEEERNHWERIIFAELGAGGGADPKLTLNDFLVKARSAGDPGPALGVSEALCELLATRRSMLFGLSLAKRFVNVLLPHALLVPLREDAAHEEERMRRGAASWILQPVVSLIRVDSGIRRTYSLSVFLIPVRGSSHESRKMPTCEIKKMVNAGWGLSSSLSRVSRFDAIGPLPGYLAQLVPDIDRLVLMPSACGTASPAPEAWCGIGLRETIEVIAFGVALRMAQGSDGRAGTSVKRQIGDGVVTSLGNSRVSAAIVVDEDFDRKDLDDPKPRKSLPGSLASLVPAIAGEVRIPSRGPTARDRAYRLDRGYIDHGSHAIAVLPSNRCLVVTSDAKAQYGRWESGLMQAGWIAYTVIASANAIGAIRAVDRDLEKVARSDPGEIVDAEHDVTVDLHELYDLDITWEAYRLRYRQLREKLGITGDYEALRNKLDSLYRETSAHFEARAQRWLLLLTAAIVVLSALIFIGDFVKWPIAKL